MSYSLALLYFLYKPQSIRNFVRFFLSEFSFDSFLWNCTMDSWLWWSHCKYTRRRLKRRQPKCWTNEENIRFVWFGLVYGISTIVGYLMLNPFLYIETVLFQTIQFSISTQFSSIWPIDRTLSGVTILGQVDLGVMAIKRYFTLPKASALLKPHHQII